MPERVQSEEVLKHMNIIGHKRQKDFLERVYRGDFAHHMFIFHGPQNVGKRTIAQTFAVHLVERGEAVEEISWTLPEHITAKAEILWLAPEYEEKKGIMVSRGITVEAVRKMRKRLALTASGARVLIIDDAQEMTRQAQNALLKAIEEPGESTTIICITSDSDRLLPTVRSRGVMLGFGLLTREEMASCDVLADLQELAYGRPGRAYVMQADEELAADAASAVTLLREVFAMPIHQRITLASDLATDATRALHYLDIWIGRVRHVAHERGRWDTLLLAKKLLSTRDLLQNTNTNKKLVLENLLIHL